jgi:hypothetical protein
VVALATLATLAIVAGCGGSASTPPERVSGPTFVVEVPGGSKVERRPTVLTASQGDTTLEVRRFPLRRAYTPALFDQAGPEIQRVARRLASRLGAKLSGRTVTVADGKAWQYDFVHGDVFEQLTFVLHGKTEYQLYCRRPKNASNRPCEQLVASFKLR